MSEEKPVVKLIGGDGNAFAILGTCSKAMERADWDQKQRDAVLDEMREGDYDHLLSTAMKYFDVQ